MKDILVKEHAMHEVHSYIWSDAEKCRELGIAHERGVKIINASNPDNAYVRTTMLPTLLYFAKENKSYKDSYSIFEIGHTADAALDPARNNYCTERKKLAAVIFSKEIAEEELFTKAVDAIYDLVEEILHTSVSFKEKTNAPDYCHPQNVFDIIVGSEIIGYVSVAHPTVCENMDKKCAVAFFEIETEKFASIEAKSTAYKEPSKFPAIEIDMTFNTGLQRLDFDKISALAKEASDGMLKDMWLHDVYEKEDGRAITLRFSFEASDRTLSKQELMPITDAVAKSLSSLGMSI
jgi:phenylalanyl-tRNA synthetase beta chain